MIKWTIPQQQVPNSPDAVARDDLAAALLQCLTATPAFAEFCITLLLEKLDSQLRIAKLDSLRLLVGDTTGSFLCKFSSGYYSL
jgi:hypothetical protein